jgi:nucleoid DNA-binding protein
MQELITSFIIQSKECKLADIGKFKKVNKAAESDIANKQILPPSSQIQFTGREEKISDGLIKYIADKKRITTSESLAEIKKWCADTKEKLKNGEAILFESLGVLKRESFANIFTPVENEIHFFETVPAIRVIHKNSEHAMLVGDRETTSSVMNQFYHEEEAEAKSNAWKITAIILLALALVILFFHFYGHPFSLSELGNQQKVAPASAPATYFSK